MAPVEHNVLWLIQHAPTEEILLDVLKYGSTLKGTAWGLRKRWCDEAQKRFDHLRANPPSFERISVVEAMAIDPEMRDVFVHGKSREAMTYKQVVEAVNDFRLKHCADLGIAFFEDHAGLAKPAEVYFAEPIEVPAADPRYLPEPLNNVMRMLMQEPALCAL